ncbi:ATP-binding protein, partial [Candidatus Woesearchaeota archaeon]|nr:ATP-binding protein [Candidatus Woesearchaeota archaeon]
MKVAYELKNTGFVIGQISQLYAADPVGALKEYVTNAIDAFSEASLQGGKTKACVGVVINKEAGTITVQDNALGMSYDFLSELPRSIGESTRRGVKEMRGEKGFGMLAYCGFGRRADVLTRTVNDNGSYSSLVMGRDELSADVDRLEARVVKSAFDTGTRVSVSGVPRKTIEDYFTPKKLKHSLGETYEPLIRSGEVEIYVGWHGKKERLERVEAPEHK